VQQRLDELKARRDAAATSAERRKADLEIEKLLDDSDESRPHAIYGWSIRANPAGNPINSTRSMTGFILDATEKNNKAIAAAKEAHKRGKPAIIALDREGSSDLFTFSGRNWYRVDRAATIATPITMPDPGMFHIPPDAPMTDEDRRAVTVSLRHERSEAGDSGTTLHRYMIQIQCEQPPATASRLRVWVAAHVELDGEGIGPIIQQIEVPKSKRGRFAQLQSFEFIALAGRKLDAGATTAELLAIAWE
jgi:hypothetical protein